MLRFAPFRFCSKTTTPQHYQNVTKSTNPNQNHYNLSLGQKKSRFFNIISQLDSLHMVLLRREASPKELRSQAKFILGDDELTKMIMYEPEVVPTNHVAAFASQIAALSSLRDPPHPQFFAKLGHVFEHHLQIVQKDMQDGDDLFGSNNDTATTTSPPTYNNKESPLASLQKRRQEQLGLSEEEKRQSSLLNSLRQKHPNDYSSGQDVIFDSQHRKGSLSPDSRSISESGLVDHHHHIQATPVPPPRPSAPSSTPVPPPPSSQLLKFKHSSHEQQSTKSLNRDDAATQAANSELYDRNYTQLRNLQ